MRRPIVPIALLLVTLGVTALPASAMTSCPLPHASGVRFYSLTESGIGCGPARDIALHVATGRGSHAYSCTARTSGGTTTQDCRNRTHHAWRVHFAYQAHRVTMRASAASTSSNCPAPHVAGFTVSALSQTGIGCEPARELAVRVIRGHHLHGYSCTHRISGRYVNATCVHTTHPWRLGVAYHVH